MSRDHLCPRVLTYSSLVLLFYLAANSARASLPGDEHWDNQFGTLGPNATAGCISAIGNNIYVGGSFASAGNTKASGVARFDGTNWFPLNAGLLGNPVVVSLQVDGNNLYAGGIFTNADDPGAVDTARWDGTNWSATGITNGVVFVVKRNGNDLYFGGVFTNAGGVANTTNIARFDGTNWFSLASGLSGNTITVGITAMEFQGNNVYVGGAFTNVSGVPAVNIAYYDGSSWHAMGNPFNGQVTALKFFGPYLYAGGIFTNSALQFTNIARWDGSAWSALPGGSANRQVEDFASTGTNLFIGGWFTQIGGIACTGVVSFDGSNWSTVGGGFVNILNSAGQVYKTLWYSNQLYVVGAFERAGTTPADNVARWDGTNWWSLGGQTSKGISVNSDSAQALLVINQPNPLPSGLYVGGTCPETGNILANSIGLWDGTNWNSVGSGFSGTITGSAIPNVRSLATDGTLLYAAGNFLFAGGNPASGIASWDGNNWSSMAGGVDNIANTMALDNSGILWVGGFFTNAGGGFSKGLAEWYGGWVNFGTVDGGTGASSVNSIVFDGTSKVYIGGNFTSAGGIAATNVAYLDEVGYIWNALGLGFNAKINTLAYGNGTLYAGGSFTTSGTTVMNHIAQWNGSAWAPMGSGMTGGASTIVNSIVVAGTNVYATGNFTNAGGVIATNIARWDGTSWHSMGSGLDIARAGFALTTNGNDLFVVGNFTTAGDKPSQIIARWNDQMNFYPPANMLLTRTTWQTNRQFKTRLTGTSGQSYIIQGSTDLSTWTPLVTNSVMFYDFMDPAAASFPNRYYRAVLNQ